jgi:hypothetical protein
MKNNFDIMQFINGSTDTTLNVKKPVKYGLHQDTVINNVKLVIEPVLDENKQPKTDANGNPVMRLKGTFDLTFADGATASKAFFNQGVQFALEDIKKQLEDYGDYETPQAFAETLRNKKVSVYVFQKEYKDDTGIKQTKEFRFWTKVPSKYATNPATSVNNADEI